MRLKKPAADEEFKACTYPHMKLLYNVALKYCGNVFDAEDIVQESYMMAFHKFHQLRDKSRSKPWLLKILRNNFLKSYHKNKSQKRLKEPDYIEFLKSSMKKESAEQILEKVSDRQLVEKAMAQLPEKYQAVLWLYYMDDMLYKEIAAALEIPIGTVMSRLTRAREGLKNILVRQSINQKDNILNIDFKEKAAHSR